MSIKTRMILAFFGIVLLTSILCLWLSYTTSRTYFLEETRQHLMKLCSTVAKTLDGDVLRRATIENLNDEAYQVEKDKLRRFRAAVPEARVAYFYRPANKSGVMEIIVDALEPGEQNAVTQRPEDRYYDTEHNDTPEMRDGLTRPSADPAPVADESGIWMSGYAPVYARDGTVAGAFGMDLPADDIQAGQNKLLLLLGLSTAGSLVVACIAGLLVARAIARPIQRLAEATHAIAGGDLDAKVEIERPDEIGRLGRSFNKMVLNLRAMAEALKGYTTDAIETHEERMALQLQRVLLPTGPLTRPGISVTAALRPVPWGGGDTYQHFLFGNGSYALLSYGHVHASGLLACSLVTLVQSRLGVLVSDLMLRPAEILTEIARSLQASAPGLAPVDYLCAVYDIERRWLAYGVAGEVAAFLVRPSTAEVQRLQAEASPALGAPEPAAYLDMDLEMQAGDRLVVISSYAARLTTPEGLSFGWDRLEDLLRAHATDPPEGLRTAVFTALEGHARRPERIEDDLTVMVAELGDRERL